MTESQILERESMREEIAAKKQELAISVIEMKKRSGEAIDAINQELAMLRIYVEEMREETIKLSAKERLITTLQ